MASVTHGQSDARPNSASRLGSAHNRPCGLTASADVLQVPVFSSTIAAVIF